MASIFSRQKIKIARNLSEIYGIMSERIRIITLCILVSLCFPTLSEAQTTIKQGNPVPVNFCIKEHEMKLFRMVNEYRSVYGLAPIPLSRSLCYVASLHVKDLYLHHSENSSCNLHSWSAKGFWRPFCYPQDENKKNSVWDKPREITRYPAKGYEIIYWENTTPKPDSILLTWTMESYFNDFLMNTGIWEGKHWNAFGIAIYENYASAWFGEVADPEGEAWVCGNHPGKQKTDSVKVESKPVVPVSSPDTLSTFYIIIRTNVTRKVADQIVAEQKAAGYPDARVLMNNGKTRISVFETRDRNVALEKLKEIKKVVKDAWLLKQK
jgi:hypothetical protein